jgi:hypothetical protein
MQIFKGRDAQQLERLAAAPSSWRVLNLAYATRMLRAGGAPSQLRFFQTHQLNNALFAKHTVREHERSMFAAAPAVATKLLIPLDRHSFAHGAISLFVGERTYVTAMRQWLGLKVARSSDPAAVSPDAAILFRLAELPAFDPFLLGEAFGGGAYGVSPEYLNDSMIDDAAVRSFILRELTPLIRMAAGCESAPKVAKFVDSIFGPSIGASAADFLTSMNLPQSQWDVVVSAWKGALRYEIEFAATKERFAAINRQLAELNAYGHSERMPRAAVELAVSSLRDLIGRIFGNVATAARDFNSARRAAIIEAGQIGELKTYLEDLPEIVAAYATARAIAQHVLSYWEFRTRGLEHTRMPAESFCGLAHDLAAMEIQLNGTQFVPEGPKAGLELRAALTLLQA